MAQNSSLFTKFANVTATAAGRPATFIVAFLTVIIWACSGPIFGFSDTWQLVINTGTTILTFLMVFLIQNTQNREAIAVQLKLDELICAIKEANNEVLDIEDRDDKELRLKRDEMIERAKAAKDSTAKVDEETSKKKEVGTGR
ncbi:MAG: low affinity iron permease family protein [Acidobacteriota bacterium]